MTLSVTHRGNRYGYVRHPGRVADCPAWWWLDRATKANERRFPDVPFLFIHPAHRGITCGCLPSVHLQKG